MESDFELILDECLVQLRAGKTVEECLVAYPFHAIELRPLLDTAAQVSNIPIPRARAEAVSAGRERLLARSAQQAAAHFPYSSEKFSLDSKHGRGTLPISRPGAKRLSLGFAYRLAVLLVFVLVGAGGLTINVSARSLPGDKLYSVKRTWESLRLSLTPNDEIRQSLQERFAAERLNEIGELIQHRRTEVVEFVAPLEEMAENSWKVDGYQIQIGPNTDIVVLPKIGQLVYVRASLLVDGTLTAIQVRVSGQTLPKSSATKTPALSFTPTMAANQETETPETSLNPQEPTEAEKPSLDPTEEPEIEASPTPGQNAHTPEPTEVHDRGDDGTHEATEAPKYTHTLEATEQSHETLEATEHSQGTPEATDQEHATPEATDDD